MTRRTDMLASMSTREAEFELKLGRIGRDRSSSLSRLERMEGALGREMHFESSWLAYAILEDRLRSLLVLTKGSSINE